MEHPSRHGAGEPLDRDGLGRHDGLHATGEPAYDSGAHATGTHPVEPHAAARPAAPVKGGAAMGIAALVLGILALLSCWFPFVGIPLGLIAIVCGFIAHSRAKRINGVGRGLGMAGVILGLLSVVAGALVLWLGISLWQDHKDDAGFKDLTSCVQDAGTDQAKLDKCSDDFGDKVQGQK